MKPPRHLAARRALALYDTAPRGDRLHVRIRWWSAPFAEVERAVPVQGRILEIGAGHGLLSLYLALTNPQRTVVGVDIDPRKIDQARAATNRLQPGEASVSFEVVAPGELPEGSFDAVVIADVLYLLPAEARRNLLVAAARSLGRDGVVLVKETATTPRWKAALTVAQERLSTGVLRITAGENVEFAEPDAMAAILATEGLLTDVRRIDKGYPHPHVLITGRRPPGTFLGLDEPVAATASHGHGQSHGHRG